MTRKEGAPMIHFNITPEEHNLLFELLDNCLADLREEIGRTDDHTYKKMLREREALLMKLLASLRQAEAGIAQRT